MPYFLLLKQFLSEQSRIQFSAQLFGLVAHEMFHKQEMDRVKVLLHPLSPAPLFWDSRDRQRVEAYRQNLLGVMPGPEDTNNVFTRNRSAYTDLPQSQAIIGDNRFYHDQPLEQDAYRVGDHFQALLLTVLK